MALSEATLTWWNNLNQTATDIPLISGGISAGFPSPATDFIDLTIDLNRHLIKHPAATFFARVSGSSMQDAGIGDGDLLIIDKGLEATNGRVAVCYLDGEFTLKRIQADKTGCWLLPANPDYSPIRVTDENEFLIWGIITYVIKAV